MLGSIRAVVLTTLLATLAVSSPGKARSSYAVKDSHRVPAAWKNIGHPAADHTIRLTLSLKQQRFHELEKHLWEASDPYHTRYGQHLSKAQTEELIAPSKEALEQVHDWLLDNDIEHWELEHSAAKDWIKVSLPVEDVERLLDTEYSVFEHEDGTRLVRAPEYSLPSHLHEHISMVNPTNSFLKNGPRASVERRASMARPVEDGSPYLPFPQPADPVVAAVCNFSAVTPDCLRTIYGTINYTVQVPGKNKVALNNFLGEVNIRSDIKQFLEMFRPETVAGASEFVQISIDGGTLAQVLNSTLLQAQTGIEGNLDAETILGISWPTPMTAYSTGGLDPSFVPDLPIPTNFDEPYLDWVNYVLGLSDIPQVISTSYGDDEQTVSYAYAVEVCNQFAVLGARGVTLLFAAGDDGVGTDGMCFGNGNDNVNGSFMFLPSFPDDCPYVTSVGATMGFPEQAAFDPRFSPPFTSGAGFSNYFPQPSYQSAVVDAYIASLDGLYDGFYNKSGRGYPDIAALGQIYNVVWNGSVIAVDGTSASTPASAGVLTLVNDALLAAGKPVLGFMNPWLYSVGNKAFQDVTSGSSAGCNTSGFPANVGWDAVTGFGTPLFPDILQLRGIDKGKAGGGGWKAW